MWHLFVTLSEISVENHHMCAEHFEEVQIDLSDIPLVPNLRCIAPISSERISNGPFVKDSLELRCERKNCVGMGTIVRE